MVIRDHTELRVYQVAFDGAMEIYQLVKTWPDYEKYGLADQIRRSSRSVCGNIAEAWRKRRYPAHFVSKLSDADAEAAETGVWLDFAWRCEYVDEDNYVNLRENYNHICGMLTVMIKNPEKWCNT
ncbi:MAG: four helix bundle protein [Ardenticatenaceae bacterium]|nr:four helix bundle protein [Ardenticatenaceae bacterium]